MRTEVLKNGTSHKYDMIVFCHLRWDFVYQRPQHLISRLAKDYKILVVEEPIYKSETSDASSDFRTVAENIDVCQPNVHRVEDIGPYLKRLLKKDNYSVGWFYSAAFVPILQTLEFDNVIYDCMDELSLFKGASQQLIQQENDLLAAADVVYTGGKSLYESKKQKNHNVHCFPSSVDVDHFSMDLSNERLMPGDMINIKTPIIGYYGVIDERIDLDLIKETASKCPDVSFVMIGPLAKIEDTDLPRANNIHYLGMKTYEELPNYLQYFNIAMMPFALNDSTKFISPTKTLEYMAAGKPIISTKIRDVERDFSNCVMLIDDAEDFAKAIESPMDDFQSEYEDILRNTSWDRTAEKMSLMIKRALA